MSDARQLDSGAAMAAGIIGVHKRKHQSVSFMRDDCSQGGLRSFLEALPWFLYIQFQ